jgi:hypothetical protein
MSAPPLHFSAFVMNTTSHILQGVWRQPEAGQTNFNSLEHWVQLAAPNPKSGASRPNSTTPSTWTAWWRTCPARSESTSAAIR